MTSDLFSLKGRTALITGGSRGIGRMIAAGFIKHGAKVYISARKAAVCDSTAAELSAGDGQCISLPQDVSIVEGCRSLAAAYAKYETSLDILVNNAGAAWLADFDDFPENGWDKTVDLNLKSPFFLTQALGPALRAAASKERPAKVINIASIDGIRPNPQETYSYQASKAGLIHLTRRMAARLIEDNICVNAIAPGAFASEMNRAARDSAEEVAGRIPARRIGTDEDMPRSCNFSCLTRGRLRGRHHHRGGWRDCFRIGSALSVRPAGYAIAKTHRVHHNGGDDGTTFRAGRQLPLRRNP